jgi:hypothetical protein
MIGITKKIFLATSRCPRRGWLLRHQQGQAELSLSERFRIEQGIEIGERARTLFPNGILIEQQATEDAARKTQELLADPKVTVLFEATFQYDDYAAKADVLVKESATWNLIEVKAKTVKVRDRKKDLSDLLDDMAYTTTIIGRTGLPLSSARLLLLSDTFQLGMDPGQLFASFDYTSEVKARANTFDGLLDQYAAILAQQNQPEFQLIGDCKDCEFFRDCIPTGQECTIFDIPRISEKQLQELYNQGILYAKDIPASFRCTPTQVGPVTCMRSGKTDVGDGLAGELAMVRWPAHYLDFETTHTAYPLYENVNPYELIPTQYSIHTCARCGEVLRHREYLADPKRDCRKELAERLIRDLNGDGSVLSYSPYEIQVIKKLIERVPELKEPLNNILGRIVDLIECTKCVSHPGFRGSNSIKDVLPVLVPGMTYEGLPVANGEDAMVTFAYMARGKFSVEECARKWEEMLRYCEQDTLAMVKIHEEFEKMARDL